MRKIQAMPLDREAFAPFGEYYDMLHPSGYALAGEIHKFYPDRISESCGTRVGYSPIEVKKEEMCIRDSEYPYPVDQYVCFLQGKHCCPVRVCGE